MVQIDTILGNAQIKQIRQFIHENGLEESLIDFVARDDKQKFKEWLEC